jgi:hypothetical protein
MAEHHPLGDIEYLNENLLNSYLPEFPILKELIQNAEDAKASCLDYGWIDGISNAKHPLLKSPALFMLDNGEFTNENAKSIRYILGGSSKPNQQDSIGKFGLGLKSVFHLCEAFFYIAPDITDCRYRTSNIFNPWAGAENKDEYHENWDTFCDTDKELIKKSVNSILEKQDYQKQWFILWIPLRQRSHQTIQSEKDIIPLYIRNDSKDFFGETPPDFLGNNETRRQINILMTLLGTVNLIRYWERDLNKPKFEIRLDKNSKRRLSLSNLVNDEEHKNHKKRSIAGKIYDGENAYDGESALSFAGSEAIAETAKFSNIVKCSEFPEKFRCITPHNAIVFSQLSKKLSNTHSSLTLRTAVFLPIGDDYSIECESKYSYYLTLHGYFFVDFARTGVLGWDKNDLKIDVAKDDGRSSLQKEWNFSLYQVILSRILEEFNLFVNEYKLPESEVSELCKALHSSKLFKEKSNREIICQNKEFVLCITSKGKEWKLLDRKRVLPLPKIPDWDLFPKLKEKAESSEWLLTLSDAPNLRFSNLDFDKWDDSEIIEVLSNLSEKDVLKDSTAINFLVLFFKEPCQNSVSDKIQKALIKLLKEGLSQLTWSELNPNVRKLKELVSLISAPRVIYIYTKDIDERFFKSFVKIKKINVLMLPKELFIDSPRNGTRLQFEDAETFILNLNLLVSELKNGKLDSRFFTSILNLLRQILVLSEKNLNRILLEHQDCRCLIGQYHLQKEIEFYSYNEFLNLKNKSILFKEPSDQNQKNLIDYLVKASHDIKPVVVDDKMAYLIKNIPEISPAVCSTAICKRILGANKHPSLAEPENRKQLLTELLKEVD